jgi:hypothetical protein
MCDGGWACHTELLSRGACGTANGAVAGVRAAVHIGAEAGPERNGTDEDPAGAVPQPGISSLLVVHAVLHSYYAWPDHAREFDYMFNICPMPVTTLTAQLSLLRVSYLVRSTSRFGCAACR